MVLLQPSGDMASIVSDMPTHWKSASAAMPDSQWIWRADDVVGGAIQRFFMTVAVPAEVTSVEGMLSIAADHQVLVRVNGGDVFNSMVPEADDDASVEAGFATYIEIDEWLVLGNNVVEFQVQQPAAATGAQSAGLIFELSTVYRYPSADGVCLLP